MMRSTSSGHHVTAPGVAGRGVSPAPRGMQSRATVGPFAELGGPVDDALEREADSVANAVVRGGFARLPRPGWAGASVGEDAIQRKGAEGDRAEVPAPDPVQTPAAPALLVEDDGEVARGQMRKSEFMAALRSAVCAGVDRGLRGTGRDSNGCPWVEHWLGYYDERSAAQIERALHRYAPEAAGAAAASDYVKAVAARVGRAAERWAVSGEITGVPDDMPGGGSAIAAVGGLFFKAWPGGGRPADAVRVGAELGAGQPLPGAVRARMEGVFGTSFGGVRVHADPTAARLAQQLHAHAFTLGSHVAFGEGEFQPGTPMGDALLAHELAHVVQQGSAGGRPAPMRRSQLAPAEATQTAAEGDADRVAGGAVAALWGPERRLLREQVTPKVRSGLQLRRCASKPKAPATPEAGRKLTPREERDKSIEAAGDRLREVSAWIVSQQKFQNLPDVKGVLSLDPAQAKNVQAAIGLLERAEALFGTKAVEGLPAMLDGIPAALKEAKRWSGATGGDTLDQYETQLKVKQALGQAVEASDNATGLVAKLEQSLDAKEVRTHTDAIAKALEDIRANKLDLYDGTEEIKRHVRDAKAALAELRRRFEATPKSIGRILFVLRSFLALNVPGRTKAPTADEAKAYAGSLDEVERDFSIVFAKGGITRAFDAFALYAVVLGKQLAERAKMEAAKIAPASPIPSQGNAEDYFASLKGKKNADVFAAYEAYAAAFFYHRHVDKFDDMNVSGVSDLYARPLSVFGLRPLVCTGYALLGSHLLRKAGAAFVTFTVAVRATEDDIVDDKISAGHAIAQMKRNGHVFFVSNGIIVLTEEDGIGEDAVAWEKSKAPRHKASGATIRGANDALRQRLSDVGDAIRARRAKGKK